MKIVVLPVGEVDRRLLDEIRKRLVEVFPRTVCRVSDDVLPLSSATYDSARQQYESGMILSSIFEYVERTESGIDKLHKVLGVAKVDLYASGLNFVFGQAQCPGKAALISLHRLRPEFYGEPSDDELFFERAVKEAVHEIGHTLGLEHCANPLCVMRFSLHIGMTDQKQSRFCERCSPKVKRFIERL